MGIKPGPERIKELKTIQHINELKDQLKEMESSAQRRHPLVRFKLQGKINNLKAQIRNLEQSLQSKKANTGKIYTGQKIR